MCELVKWNVKYVSGLLCLYADDSSPPQCAPCVDAPLLLALAVQERVEKAGGQVLYWNGHRVMGVLAMSRAIGDHCLRPYVIPEPEITVFARHANDEILLLASDGLWDVMANQVGGRV